MSDDNFDWERAYERNTEHMVFTLLLCRLEEMFPGFSAKKLREDCLLIAEHLRRRPPEPKHMAEFADKVRVRTIMSMVSQSKYDVPRPSDE